MKNIKWVGIIKAEDLNVKGDIPISSTKLIEASSMNRMMVEAILFLVPSILITILSMFFMTYLAHSIVISPIGMANGFITGFMLIIAHEFLHVIVYPKSAEVTLGILASHFSDVVLASYPLSKRRFIVMSLLLLISGLIPLFLFIASPPSSLMLNGILLGVATIG